MRANAAARLEQTQSYFLTREPHRRESNLLVWVGDDIGQRRDGDVTVRFKYASRDPKTWTGTWEVPLDGALAVAGLIDEEGLFQIESALAHAAQNGCLSPSDLAIWDAYEPPIARKWLPVAYVESHCGGSRSEVIGSPARGHHVAMCAAQDLCDSVSGVGYTARLLTDRDDRTRVPRLHA